MSRDMIDAASAHAAAPSALLPGDRLAAETHMDAVTLYVRDIDAMVAFYTNVIALEVLANDAADGRAALVTLGRGTTPLVVLREARDLPPRRPGEAGLFHTAILFADAAGLAATLARVAQLTPQLYTGAGDHLVSEAFYLDDPEGNGIELYVDRPRDQWRWRDGHVEMATLHLDPNAFMEQHLDEAVLAAPHGAAATLGHVHLQVGDIPTARRFYVDTLGFEATTEMGSALFVSAGGYHHHMAMNTWASMGAGPRPVNLGLGEVSIVVPTRDEIGALTDRLAHAGIAAADDGAVLAFADPWRNEIRVAVA